MLSYIKFSIKIIKFIFTPIAIVCLIFFLWNSKELLFETWTNSKTELLIASIFFWQSLHFISPFFTTTILSAYSTPIKYKEALFIHINYVPAKYIPGGVWHTVARASCYNKKRIPKKHITYYLITENIVSAAITLSIGGYIVSSLSSINTLIGDLVTLLSIACAIILILLPFVLTKVFSCQQGKRCIAIAVIEYIKAISYNIIHWIIASISFILFIKSFPNINLSLSIIEVSGIYIFSWGIGFITIFSPQGIGVSEYVASQLLESNMSIINIVSLLTSFRIIILIGDINSWLLSKVLFKNALNNH